MLVLVVFSAEPTVKPATENPAVIMEVFPKSDNEGKYQYPKVVWRLAFGLGKEYMCNE